MSIKKTALSLLLSLSMTLFAANVHSGTINNYIAHSSVYQWSADVPNWISKETNAAPKAFLWVPEQCKQIEAIIFGQHNMSEEDLFSHPQFREKMRELNFAILWVTPLLNMPWDVTTGVQDSFSSTLNILADISGYSEIATVPIVPVGHSACATFPWNFAAWNQERTLAILSLHGDSPRTNLCGYGGANIEWGRDRNINGIPALMIEGEYEWWEERVTPSLAFKKKYPKSCISFLADVGRGHFDVSNQLVDYITMFLRKVAENRLPNLDPIDPHQGYLAERWHPEEFRDRLPYYCERCAENPNKAVIKRHKTAPYNKYKGNKCDAFWYLDKEIAEATEKYYAQEQGKKDQYVLFSQKGELVPYKPKDHVKQRVPFLPENDGVTFHLSGIFVDSTRSVIKTQRGANKVKISRICGPVKQINDTTFQLDFYRMGLNNSRRTAEIVLLASVDADNKYKSAVQELSMRLPYPLKNGNPQTINFPQIENCSSNVKVISLNATSSSSMPVYYYVKEGPAIVENNKLHITSIPPKAKLPITVTVVAWQYGLSGVWNTAAPVEQTFEIF